MFVATNLPVWTHLLLCLTQFVVTSFSKTILFKLLYKELHLDFPPSNTKAIFFRKILKKIDEIIFEFSTVVRLKGSLTAQGVLLSLIITSWKQGVYDK